MLSFLCCNFDGILKMLIKATQALGGNGGIMSTSRVPCAGAPVLMAIKHMSSDICSEKDVV
jgi:hypothetical protein